MKKLSFFLMAMLMSVMSFAAEATATISFANKAQRTVYTTSQQVWEQNGIVVTNDKASSTTNVGDYANPARFYKNSKVTIQCTLGNIKKIEITGWGDSKYNVWATSIGSEATASGSSVIITPTAVSDTYVANMTGGQARAGQMVVTYEVSDEGFVATPAIEGEQYFKESATVSMKAAEGLKVYYTLDGTEPTTASTEYAAPFEVTETTTVKAIAHDGENASEVVTVVFKKMEVLTPSEAVALCTTTESADKYIIRGYVTKIATAYDAGYNNITFWLADEADGGEILQAYRAVPVTENDKTVAEGAYVEIVGKLVLFGSSKTPEVPAGGTYTIIPAPVVNHTITVSANPAEAGTVTGGGEFEETDEITVKAVANDGYEFVNWTENEVEVATTAEYTFEVLADRALVANFKKAAPATETVYFINTKKWAAVKAHAWDGKATGTEWPGLATVKEAEQIAGYDVYSFTANVGDYASIIFNNNNQGSQTPNLVWTAGKYYVMDMGWLTKEEAETKLAAPLPEVWTIVGAAGLMAKDRDLNDAEIAMTKQGDGTYKLEKKGITLTAGTYEYKAAKDHDWAVSVPAGADNQKLTISTSGIYDVTFVLDVTAKKLTATATLKQAAVIIPTVVIAGDMNSWSTTKDKFTMSADSLTATLKTTLAAKSYGFKMVIGGNWQSDAKTITRAANSTKFTGANGDNSTLTADIAGDYIFTWEYATKTLTVTYPTPVTKYTVTLSDNTGGFEPLTSGAGEYEEGAEVTVSAVDSEGWVFVGWMDENGDIVSNDYQYTFVIEGNVALVAIYAQLMALEVNDLEIITEPVVGLTGTAELMPGMTLSFELIVDDSEQGEDGEFYLTEDSKVYLNDETELEFIEGIALIDMMSNTAQAQVLAAMGETLYLFNLDMSAATAEPVELVLTDAIVAINEELGTLTFNVPTGEGEGYFVELSGYTAPGVHEGPQICLFETPEVVAFANYVETSVVDGVITLTGEFTSFMGAKFDLTISGKLPTAEEPVEIVGVVKRALQLGESTVVLTHEADGTAHIYNIVGEEIAEVSQEGVVAVDPENLGDMLAISDIALTEDGKLIASNKIVCQSEGYVDEGYKRGEFRAYIWNDLDSNPTLFLTSKQSSNWFRSVQGHTIAYKGTSTNGTLFTTGVTATGVKFRYSVYNITDGVHVDPSSNNSEYYHFTKGSAYATDVVGANYEIVASPLANVNWIFDADKINPLEIVDPLTYNTEVTEAGKIAENLGQKYNGNTVVTVGEQHLMVSPYANAEGQLAGVKVLDITNGLTAATVLKVADLDAPVAATAAATAVAVADNVLTITLVADAALHVLEVELEKGPATALENIAVDGKAVKAIINGQLIIIKNGVQYNAQGQVVK